MMVASHHTTLDEQPSVNIHGIQTVSPDQQTAFRRTYIANREHHKIPDMNRG
ncbi:hypothetical protein [Aeromonas bestiarum]|uniref:hypothetical protein n=1 Tax=Aeromonas bestiarum TaxID=105751 RepID=UPI0032B14EFE